MAFLPLPGRARGSREAAGCSLSCGTRTNHPTCASKEVNGICTNDVFVLRSLFTITKTQNAPCKLPKFKNETLFRKLTAVKVSLLCLVHSNRSCRTTVGSGSEGYQIRVKIVPFCIAVWSVS